jgi:M6 family metalloprotease-like protein
MCWPKFSCASLSWLLGVCVFSVSPVLADSAKLPVTDMPNSSEKIQMDKIIYSENRFSTVPDGLSRIRSSISTKSFSMGERYFPVLLVSTADYKSIDSAFVFRMFNEEGFSENGYYGSVRDYFIASSAGLFKPTFDIYPITLSNNFSSYQSDASFILPALDLLVERNDFKSRADKYESTIPFMILHPLFKDDAEKSCDDFFNHAFSLRYSANKIYSKNGYRFNDYAFVAQKAKGKSSSTNSKDVDMLGSYVHEFSHVMGLKDLYSADKNGYATVGPLPYDVMSLGCYNGNGNYPPVFSAFERETMGWLKPTEIEDNDSIYELKNISGMQAYAVSNPNHPNEYYVIEYRPAVGFDSKIGSSSYSGKQGKNGVLIWYIDYDVNAFYSNDPNGDLNHQRVEVRSVLSKNQDNFTGFNFVNKGGKAKIDGIFNVVFDGDERVCFTVNRSKSLDKCPENKVVSSSSVDSPISSSSAAVAKSSSSKANEPAEASSSSGKTALFAEPEASKVQMHTSHGMLNVEVPLGGAKTLRFYDVLGNVIRTISFDKQSVSIDVSGWNRSAFMQLDVNGKRLFAKQVKFR